MKAFENTLSSAIISYNTRCPICLNLFCCVDHKNSHLKKNHPHHVKRSHELLQKVFQKKAERIIINAEKYKARIRNVEDNNRNNGTVNNPDHRTRLPAKRTYSATKRQVVSTSIVITGTRKMLIPTHKSREKLPSLSDGGRETTSLFKNAVVKTSTPIVKTNLVQITPQDTWDISQTSSIGSYHTPSDHGTDRIKTNTVFETPMINHYYENNSKNCNPMAVKSQSHWSNIAGPSPRSIISKKSKYNYSDCGLSPKPNTSKCRKVTFSFGSNNSSPLEVVQEVEICKETKQKCVFEYNINLRQCLEIKTGEEESIEEENGLTKNIAQGEGVHCFNGSPKVNVENKLPLQISRCDKNKYGLFECVSNMIRSAVPILTSWRGIQSRAKRLRSPDTDLLSEENKNHSDVEIPHGSRENSNEIDVVRSPDHKRLCIPNDMRLNSIKPRRPISQK